VKTTARPQQDPRLVQGRVARRLRAHRPRAAAGAPQQGRPAGAEADRLAAAGRRHPRARLQEGRRLLHRARRREDLAEGRRQQGYAAPQAGRGRRGGALAGEDLLWTRRKEPALRRPERQTRRSSASASRACRDVRCAWPVLPPGVRRSIVGLRVAGSRHHRSTATTARTWSRCAKDPERLSRSPGTGTRGPASRWRSRWTPGDRHRLLEDLSRSVRRGGLQHRRGALPRSSTRWSRTAS
jgi:hypothetical protein